MELLQALLLQVLSVVQNVLEVLVCAEVYLVKAHSQTGLAATRATFSCSCAQKIKRI